MKVTILMVLTCTAIDHVALLQWVARKRLGKVEKDQKKKEKGEKNELEMHFFQPNG